MFTGIVTDLGKVLSVEGAPGRRATLRTAYPPESLPLGASVACAGVCLTVTGKGTDEGGSWMAVDLSPETLRVTTLGTWKAGSFVNLERPLKVGDELGGHIVAGHVDGVGRLEEIAAEGSENHRLSFTVPAALARFIAAKGSIAIDGVSLTVNTAQSARFTVNIIPHTLAVTSLGALKPGDLVNVEIDTLARYLDRLMERDSDAA
jgi:riboflavin synthase